MPKVSDLTAATAVDANDELYAVVDGNSRKLAAGASLLGYGQTWQLPTRAHSTSYQNTTGRPIQASIKGRSTAGVRAIEVSADNATWISVGNTSSSTEGRTAGVDLIIPPGWYYRINGETNALVWAELR